MSFMSMAKMACVDSKKPAINLLCMVWLLVACNSGDSLMEQDQADTAMKFSVPGGAPLLRAVDADSITATIEWHREGEGGFSLQHMTRNGVSEQWGSQPITVIPGELYHIFITWRATGVDGNSVIYARQDFSYTGSSASDVISLSDQPYQFNLFNEDGDDANNFEELLVGTPPTGTLNPIPTGDSSAGATTDGETQTVGNTTSASTAGTPEDSAVNNSDIPAILGIWDITRGSDVQYLETTGVRALETTEGVNTKVWDYRGDAWDNGQNCFVATPSFFLFGAGLSVSVFGEEIFVDLSIADDKVTFTDTQGPVAFPRAVGISSTDFNTCGEI